MAYSPEGVKSGCTANGYVVKSVIIPANKIYSSKPNNNPMNLTKIHLHHLRMPLVSPFETSFGRAVDRDCILVEVETDAGLIGWGEVVADRDPGYAYETVETAWHILRDYIVPQFIGKPFLLPDAYVQQTQKIKGHGMAKAGLEMALWDLWGQRDNRSLQDLLGAKRERVPVGVSVGLQDSPDELVEVVAGYVRDGYQRIKLKIKPGRDVGEVKAVRDAFPDIQLQVDANSAYTLDTADALRPLDAYDLLLIEQPLSEDDLWDHAKLQAQLTTPICLDESIIHPRSAQHALEMKSCRVINIKQGRVGGLVNAKAIHDMCAARGVPVWCGGMLETGVGRAANLALASLPNFTLPGDISATERYYHQDVTHEVFTLNDDSTVTVPTQPGLGVHINRDALAGYRVRDAVFAHEK